MTARRSAQQKYCSECSAIKDAERGRLWARGNHRPRDLARPIERARLSANRARGVVISAAQARPIFDAIPAPDLTTIIRLAVPFDWRFSKNAAWQVGRGGHIFLSAEVRALREALALQFKMALKGTKWPQRKTYVDILVQKPDHRGDAVNVVDFICDALKNALSVDDRWFSLRFVDWQIIKDQPKIYIGVGRDGDEDQQVCSYCGRILLLRHFWKDRHGRLGVGRECTECLTGKPLRSDGPGVDVTVKAL